MNNMDKEKLHKEFKMSTKNNDIIVRVFQLTNNLTK